MTRMPGYGTLDPSLVFVSWDTPAVLLSPHGLELECPHPQSPQVSPQSSM